MGRFSISLLSAVGALVGSFSVAASPLGNGKEFSAEQVQVAADGTRTVMQRMFVGASQLRFEQLSGQPSVMIADIAARKGYRLIPDSKQYMELPLPPQMTTPGVGAPQDPCAALPGFNCVKQGEESINGRVTEKWEISGNHPRQGRVSSVQWIDKERRIPVKHQMPNGASFSSRMVADEVVNGRPVEKWESVAREGDQVSTSHFWYDPELNLRVREEFPGGGSRELSNIQVGPQPAHLFQLPSDYRRVAAPQRQMPPRGQVRQGGGYGPQSGRQPPPGGQGMYQR